MKWKACSIPLSIVCCSQRGETKPNQIRKPKNAEIQYCISNGRTLREGIAISNRNFQGSRVRLPLLRTCLPLPEYVQYISISISLVERSVATALGMPKYCFDISGGWERKEANGCSLPINAREEQALE